MDSRPQLERTAATALRACVLLIAGCALLGGGLAAVGIVWLTTPKEKPC